MIDIVTNLESLQKYRQQWDDLAERFESPLLGYDWFYSCINSLCHEKSLYIIIDIVQNKVEGIAPLCINEEHDFKRLEIIGSSSLQEPGNLIYSDYAALIRLLAIISQQRLPVVLLRMPDNIEFNNALKTLGRLKNIIIKKPTAPAHYINISTDWETYFSSLPSKRRYNFKRKRKCLEKKGEAEVVVLSPTQSQLEQVLQTAFAIEDNGWKGKNNSSLLKNKTLLHFFKKYLGCCCRNGELRIFFLMVNSTEIAMHIAVENAGIFWVLKLAHIDEMSRCSPGIQLANETIKYCFENDIKRYEFLGSAEEWQKNWPNKKHNLCTILILPTRANSVLILLRLVLRKVINNIYNMKNDN